MKENLPTETTAVTEPAVPEEVTAPQWLTRTLTTIAYGIPLAFLAYVLYINYLPFGYEETFTINVGPAGDTDSSKPFYLEPSSSLSEGMVALDLSTYRELNGIAYAVFKPPVVLEDAEITVTVEGEGVSIIPPYLDFNPDDYEWDYAWDFINQETALTAKTSERARAEWPDGIVPDLTGNAFWFDRGMHFDGTSRLEMPGTADMFEDGPFTVYVEWTPRNNTEDFQQIVGHFNWELLQQKDSVVFQVGRMNNSEGQIHTVRYTIPNPDSFFNKKNSLIAVYSPSVDGHSSTGFISIIVNNEFSERKTLFSDRIWDKYGDDNLSLGWARRHMFGDTPKFDGAVHRLNFLNVDITNNILNGIKVSNFNNQSGEKFNFLLYGITGSKLKRIHVTEVN